ncbi:hypothetical protein BH09ACT8_BH09ACT8_21560 [soil metagenome]
MKTAELGFDFASLGIARHFANGRRVEPLDYNLVESTPHLLGGAVCAAYECVKVLTAAALDPSHRLGVFGEVGPISQGVEHLDAALRNYTVRRPRKRPTLGIRLENAAEAPAENAFTASTSESAPKRPTAILRSHHAASRHGVAKSRVSAGDSVSRGSVRSKSNAKAGDGRKAR